MTRFHCLVHTSTSDRECSVIARDELEAAHVAVMQTKVAMFDRPARKPYTPKCVFEGFYGPGNRVSVEVN